MLIIVLVCECCISFSVIKQFLESFYAGFIRTVAVQNTFHMISIRFTFYVQSFWGAELTMCCIVRARQS